VKNKVAPPFKKAEFDMMFNEGISKTGGLVDLGTEFNILKKSGTWYSYGEDKIGQGRENVKKYLAENPSILAEVERKVRAAAGLVEDEPAVSKKEKVKEIKEVKEVKVSKEPPEVKAVPEEEAEYIPDNE
jgi:recombination protein RecA